MYLFLIRHGTAAPRDARKYPDDDLRPLTAKGQRQLKRLAKALSCLAEAPKTIWHSPTKRTQQSAELLAKGLNLANHQMHAVPALHYNASPRALFAVLRKKKTPKAFCLVGHEPYLSEFLGLCLAGRKVRGLSFAKGAVACIEIDSLRAGTGHLLGLCTPAWLRALQD
jgi:phosphohistidine phosphatase